MKGKKKANKRQKTGVYKNKLRILISLSTKNFRLLKFINYDNLTVLPN